MLKIFISFVQEGLSTTRTSSKTKYLANMADFKHGGDIHISCVATGIHLWVCSQILKKFFISKAQEIDIVKFSKWHNYANNSQLIWNVKSQFKKFLQAKMACVSKLLQAKVWFLLANVWLTTVSVEPWQCNLVPRVAEHNVLSQKSFSPVPSKIHLLPYFCKRNFLKNFPKRVKDRMHKIPPAKSTSPSWTNFSLHSDTEGTKSAIRSPRESDSPTKQVIFQSNLSTKH